MATALLYRATCRRCTVLARAAFLATLGSIALHPLSRAEAEALAERHSIRAKLLVGRAGTIRAGHRAWFAIAMASAPRWLALALMIWLVARLAQA